MRIGSSLVRKYFLISLIGSVLPLVAVAALYDRYASQLLEQITGERIAAQLTASASRLVSFFDARIYQIETLSNYPALPLIFGEAEPETVSALDALLRIEADVPDLYGILMFGPDGRLARIVAGQAASGAPYWTGEAFVLDGLPLTETATTEIIGPVPPGDGNSGWFLIRQPMRNQVDGVRGGSIALHVRLASVTELLGGASFAGILQPVLKTPVGYFDEVGQPVEPRRQMVAGPEVIPGWRPMLLVDPDKLIEPFATARQGLFLASIVALIVIVGLFARLSNRLRRRVEPLALGAEAVASGDLQHRIPTAGSDEIVRVAKAFNSMAEKLQALIKRVVKVERLAVLGEFASGVAHEVRNPLATIKTTVQALARTEKDGERLELLEDVSSEIDRLNRVMEDLLKFGRPHTPELAAVPARQLFARIQSMMAVPARRDGVALSVHGDSDIVLRVDEDQIIQVLVNLALNAVQATPPGGAVTLRAYRIDADEATLEVCDTGKGIPPENVSRITDPFFTTRPGGSGLGLSIARQLIELNGGRLQTSSTIGRGTCMQVSLPIQGTDT